MDANKIKSKNVGQVSIFEILGQFMGDFARQGEEAMRATLGKSRKKCAFFNLSQLRGIDSLGIQAIVNSADQVSKSGALIIDEEVRRVLGERNDFEKKVRVFSNDFEVTDFFADEFAKKPLEEVVSDDRREFPRLKTILPLKIWQADNPEVAHNFFAIVTNLSEGGMFAEYIHSKSEELAKKWLYPDQGKYINVQLYLSKSETIKGKTRIIHGDPFDGGVGLEFLGLKDEDKNSIRDWIGKHLSNVNKCNGESGSGNGKGGSHDTSG